MEDGGEGKYGDGFKPAEFSLDDNAKPAETAREQFEISSELQSQIDQVITRFVESNSTTEEMAQWITERGQMKEQEMRREFDAWVERMLDENVEDLLPKLIEQGAEWDPEARKIIRDKVRQGLGLALRDKFESLPKPSIN